MRLAEVAYSWFSYFVVSSVDLVLECIMPVVGTNISDFYKDEYPFFDTLDGLDKWTDTPTNKLGSVVKYHPRPRRGEGQQNGRLLV